MPSGGLKIVSEANLGQFYAKEEEKYKEVLVCIDQSMTSSPTTIDTQHILSDSTNRRTTHQRTFYNLDNKHWQGGFATVVSPDCEDISGGGGGVFASPLSNAAEFSSALSPETLAAPSSRGGGRGGGRKPAIKAEEELSPEEEERLRIRRERNKQAAARCRKRRVDQTMTLQGEVEDWEDKKRRLQEEIHSLQAQREDLQLILDAHRGVCRRGAAAAVANGQQRTAGLQRSAPPTTPRVVVVKAEPPPLDMEEYSSMLVGGSVVSRRQLTHEEALQRPPPNSGVGNAAAVIVPPPVSSSSLSRRPKRPASLSFLAVKSSHNGTHNNTNHNYLSTTAPRTTVSTISSIEGVPIETPTSVVNSLNFDALMDGRTGLTPTNILTPISLSFSSSTSLNTPTMMSLSSSSSTPPSGCSSQQRGGHHHYPTLSELMGSPDSGLMKLVSL